MPSDIIRKAIPAAPPEVVDFVLWERTPFPFARLTARDLYKAASGYRRACEHGIRLCDHCHRPAVRDYECARCGEALS